MPDDYDIALLNLLHATYHGLTYLINHSTEPQGAAGEARGAVEEEVARLFGPEALRAVKYSPPEFVARHLKA